MLSISLGNIPVRIHFSFFLMALLLGASWGRDPVVMGLFVVIVFVSVMLHEFGHALTGRAFGLRPEIDLHGMGGTTSWGGQRMNVGAPKRILISLAGPMVGLVLAGAILLLDGAGLLQVRALAAAALFIFVRVNFYWGLFNLAPVLPLDGGNIMAQVLHIVTGGGGRKAAHLISLVLAAAGAAYALFTGQMWLAFLAGMFALQNFRALRPQEPPAAGAAGGSAGGMPRW